ncbi:unnamed protein product [Lathyrus sativus]|nr:unnamed protein product [Lathyrus sativus]
MKNTNAASKASISDSEVCKSKQQYDLKLDFQSKLASGYVEIEDDVTSFDSQRLKEPEVHGEPCTVGNIGSIATDNEGGYEPQLHGSRALCNGYSKKLESTSTYSLLQE